MADTPTSDASHDSNGEHSTVNGAPGKSLAAKDKECPYCHQHFTSSSLGRHLDQFIYKKKPDGVHNVDEIKRMRGGITRRTARHGKHDSEDPRTKSASPAPAPPLASPIVVDTLNNVPPGGIQTSFNTYNWHSTGVINDLPSAASIAGPPGLLSSTTSYPKRSSSFLYPVPKDLSTEKDTSRALELALREVLDSLRAATSRALPRPTPFPDFEIQTQSFPSLCLLLLPHPPTLLSAPQPFPTRTSCSLDPPKSSQHSLLRQRIESMIQYWKWNTLRLAQSYSFPTPLSKNLGEEHENISNAANSYQEIALSHVDLAFSHWQALSREQQYEQWSIELYRAYVRSKQEKVELEARFERLQQEAKQLQDQVEYLSKCQWPREMALWPPERPAFDAAQVKEIRGVNLSLPTGEDASPDTERSIHEKWDFEKLVGKWKRRVREDKGRRAGMAGITQASTPMLGPATSPGPFDSGSVKPSGGEAKNGHDSKSRGSMHVDSPDSESVVGVAQDILHETKRLRTDTNQNGDGGPSADPDNKRRKSSRMAISMLGAMR